MNEPVSFAPWTMDVPSVALILLGGAALILGLYLAVRGGRDRPEAKPTPGKPPVRIYAGIVGSDANPMTVFVILFSALALLWAFLYIVTIGANGLKY